MPKPTSLPVLLLSLLLLAAGGAATAAPANDPPAAPERTVPAEPEEEPQRDYTGILENPSTLEFHPDRNLFRVVYRTIRRSFVETVGHDQLFDGIVAEVATMLEQAKIPKDDLSRLDRKGDVLDQLLALYGTRVNQDVLVFAAIQGMLGGLEDPYSILMPPQDYRKLREQMGAVNFGGIGIYIELDKDKGDQLTVFEPIDGTPAFHAGLNAGDHILAIDGKSTQGITLEGAQASIRGPVGSQVVLTVRRAEDQSVRDVAITRGSIQVVLTTSRLVGDHIGYLRLRGFGAATVEEVGQHLKKLRAGGARGIVLDLRNNGGGYIDAAVGVVGYFTEPNSLVVYTQNRDARRRDYRSPRTDAIGLPVVVLINGFSASASEITAGALRDHGVATLVGEKSYGKGSVQQLYPYRDDSALKLTIARFYTPNGTVIDHKGIEPEVKLEMEPRFVGKIEHDGSVEKDTQLARALEVLEQKTAGR